MYERVPRVTRNYPQLPSRGWRNPAAHFISLATACTIIINVHHIILPAFAALLLLPHNTLTMQTGAFAVLALCLLVGAQAASLNEFAKSNKCNIHPAKEAAARDK